MFNWLVKIVGSKNERELKRIRPLLVRINELETEYRNKDDAALKAVTPAFKRRLKAGEIPR